jgi:c-di-AMP phosphodiesterase-like protein
MSSPKEHFVQLSLHSAAMKAILEAMESGGHIKDGGIFIAHGAVEDSIAKLEDAVKQHLEPEF